MYCHSESSKAYDRSQIQKKTLSDLPFPKTVLYIHTPVYTFAQTYTHLKMKLHFIQAVEVKRCLNTVRTVESVVIEDVKIHICANIFEV